MRESKRLASVRPKIAIDRQQLPVYFLLRFVSVLRSLTVSTNSKLSAYVIDLFKEIKYWFLHFNLTFNKHATRLLIEKITFFESKYLILPSHAILFYANNKRWKRNQLNDPKYSRCRDEIIISVFSSIHLQSTYIFDFCFSKGRRVKTHIVLVIVNYLTFGGLCSAENHPPTHAITSFSLLNSSFTVWQRT